jgi:hypothetical protein
MIETMSNIDIKIDMDKKLLICSIIEALFLIYMYNFFKTSYSVHHPFEIIITGSLDYLKHPIGTGKYQNKICRFGKQVSWIFGIYLLVRYWLKQNKVMTGTQLCKLNRYVAYGAIIVSLLTNLNAFIYLIPILLFEFLYYMPKIC